MKHIVSAIVTLAITSAFVGCGQPEVYSVTQWEYAFFVDSTTLGGVVRHYTETYPNTTGLGETNPDLSDFRTSIRTCSLTGSDQKEMATLEAPEWCTGGTVSFFVNPALSMYTGCEQANYDFRSGVLEKIQGIPEFRCCSWDRKYSFREYFGGHQVRYRNNIPEILVDTSKIYDNETREPVAEVYDKRVVNLNRGKNAMLIATDSTLEYLNLSDRSTILFARCKSVIVTDYRFGRVALARIDSNRTWTMVPDLDTLPPAVASLLWELVPRDNTVYNLLTGDYVTCSGGDLVKGNMVQGTSDVVVNRERVRMQ